jgi:hypothetical protein
LATEFSLLLLLLLLFFAVAWCMSMTDGHSFLSVGLRRSLKFKIFSDSTK